MPRFTYRLALVLALTTLALPRLAAASNPATIYLVPRRVELLPTADAPTRVVLHGAFFRLTTASLTAVAYDDPRCGVMYFQCQPGQETMCRMQWNELLDASTRTADGFCYGIGALNVVSTAAIQSESAPLGAPALWDLGLGVQQGVFVDGKCGPARQLACPAPTSSDGGTSPEGGGTDASPETSPPAPDASASTDATPTTPDASASTDAPPTGGGDAQTAPMLAKTKDGCAVAGGSSSAAGAGLALALLALARRRRPGA
jgi:MYXO-CTERM domain-containing protein